MRQKTKNNREKSIKLKTSSLRRSFESNFQPDFSRTERGRERERGKKGERGVVRGERERTQFTKTRNDRGNITTNAIDI